MDVVDQVLARILESVSRELQDVGMRRQRGGIARGVAWAEVAGRAPDGAWLELRVHHRPAERRLDAGLLSYEPIARGGRTIVVGERSAPYSYDPDDVLDPLIDAVRDWLERVGARTLPQPANHVD
jgi:hypothetical protein